MLTYKLEEVGIHVDIIEESYTSKCSALDNETIEKHDTYCGKRIQRGLFKSHKGKLINADVNGSYNILRLGTKSIINHPTLFNPIKTRNINELSDVYHFTFKNDKPTDRGSVLYPNSV